MLYYTKTVRASLKELDTTEKGLAKSEAAERLQLHGLNVIKVTGEPLWRKLIEPFASIFMLVLFVADGISLYHHEFIDATIIAVIITVSAIIYYVQRFSTERILRALRQHDAQKVVTLRDNVGTQLDASLLVPGDIIVLSEGEKIPADARIITATNLRVDESQLTGESQPMNKQAEELSEDKEVYEQTNMLFQGSFIVAGEARAVIIATGNETEFGQLAALSKNSSTESPVQQKIDRLLSQIIGIVAAIALVAFSLSIMRGMDITESLRFVIALSVSAVPESLPVAISVVLVLGMRRMAAKNALVRTMRAIETIGVITTIATDKTGTLTKNQLTVQDMWVPFGSKKEFTHLFARAINHSSHKMHDPLDTALTMYAEDHRIAQPHQAPLARFPFDQSVSMSGNMWHNGTTYQLVIKGAPEHVLERSDMSQNEHEQASLQLHKLTTNGYRVIAVAHHILKRPIASLYELPSHEKLTFDGFIAVADVLRPEARQAVKAALAAGVSVRMITGDHFETAYHIGKQLGIVARRDQVFDSRHMHVMSDEALERVIDNIRVFSRVIPEHKYRILALLKKRDITAMTGDGVNDVPALTNAHVGIAMGSGAHIAKDAGDIILMDDNFKSIVEAMREGRTIFANIRRMLFYLLATNAGEVLTALGSLVIGLPIPLVPVQILWVNLVTDTSMVIPLGLEPGETATMQQKPKSPNTPILDKFLISRMVLVALSMAGLTLFLYKLYSDMYGESYGRTIAFSALVVMQWAHAFNTRSEHESLFRRLRVINKSFYIGLGIAVLLQTMAVFGPLANLLHVMPVAIGDLVITGAIAFVVPILLVEIHKFIGRWRYNKRSAKSASSLP